MFPGSQLFPLIASPAPKKPLKGAGWHQWNAWQEGPDVKGTGLATVFGGGNDPGDNSVGTWNNPIGPTTQGVSLPTGRIPATAGSPFPKVPKGTLVTVYNKRTGKTVTVPVVDEGPTINDQGDSGKNGGAMADMTAATAKALGFQQDSDGEWTNDPVDIRIHGGGQYLSPQNYGAPADPNHVDPSDQGTLSKIGAILSQTTPETLDVDKIRPLVSSLKSGALYDKHLVQRFDGHLDEAENTMDSNPKLSKQEFANALTLFQQMQQKLQSANQSSAPLTMAQILSGANY